MGVSRSKEFDSVFFPYGSSNRYEFVQGCLNTDIEWLRVRIQQFKPDLVVNYAAQGEVRNSWKWPEQWYETNCVAVSKTCELVRSLDSLQMYVSVSTPEVYGTTGKDIVENRDFRPSTPYGVSKLAGDLHIETLIRRYGFPAVFTRAANVYGPHQQLYRIIPRSILYQMSGRTLTLHGGGKAQRGFVYIRDVAEATFLAASKGLVGECYHLSETGQLISVRKLVETVCDVMGVDVEGFVETTSENFGQDDRFSLSSIKAKEELGWEASTPLVEGIEEVVRWIRNNWGFLKEQPWDYVHKK